MGCWVNSTKSMARRRKQSSACTHPLNCGWVCVPPVPRIESTEGLTSEVRESLFAVRCGKSCHVYESRPRLLITGQITFPDLQSVETRLGDFALVAIVVGGQLATITCARVRVQRSGGSNQGSRNSYLTLKENPLPYGCG